MTINVKMTTFHLPLPSLLTILEAFKSTPKNFDEETPSVYVDYTGVWI